MTDAELAHTKELAFFMVERVFMNPISAKLLSEDWRKEFPDEVAVAERMKALVEALEKAQQHENEWKSLCEAAAVDLDDWREIDDKSRDLLCKLADTVIAKAEQSAEWERKAISNFEDCAEMSARLEELESQRKLAFAASNRWADKFREAEKRIDELESRTVTIEPFRSFVTDADLAALHRFAECCDDPESGGHDLEKEQVRRLEAIGALQRSGRISYITGFGDVLISITAGIKWEAE